jgi:cytochrome o ubiquinol oxidase operon protein cyoD
MNEVQQAHEAHDAMEERDDEQPGGGGDLRSSLLKYTGGLVLSIILTLASFWASGTDAVWQGGAPVLLAALAIGQMGAHLLFFLHVSSGPESTNNILALAFGVFIVGLVIFGSMIIMHSLDARMGNMPGHDHPPVVTPG